MIFEEANKKSTGSVINDEPGGNAVYIEIIIIFIYARRTSEWSHRRYLYS